MLVTAESEQGFREVSLARRAARTAAGYSKKIRARELGWRRAAPEVLAAETDLIVEQG